MKNWNKKLVLKSSVSADEVPTTQDLLVVRDQILKLYPDVDFRETNLEHYDAEMLKDEVDRRNFVEDVYDWADAYNVWVEWQNPAEVSND